MSSFTYRVLCIYRLSWKSDALALCACICSDHCSGVHVYYSCTQWSNFLLSYSQNHHHDWNSHSHTSWLHEPFLFSSLVFSLIFFPKLICPINCYQKREREREEEGGRERDKEEGKEIKRGGGGRGEGCTYE